jgi:hypothetical protein
MPKTSTRRKTKRARKASKDAVPTITPEELFARILAPKPAAPKAAVQHTAREGWYVVVDGKPVARYECKEDAEHCTRNW